MRVANDFRRFRGDLLKSIRHQLAAATPATRIPLIAGPLVPAPAAADPHPVGA